MWYECLPSVAIIFAAMGFPHLSAYYINKLVVGNYYRRALFTHEQRIQYLRDIRLSGNPYKITGLENIPDK